MNKRKVPKIRFKGFYDDWEQRKFEEIAVRSSVICSDANLPRVEYEDIVSGAGRLNKDIYAKESSKSGIAFHQGDVLYGKLRPYLQNWLLPAFEGLAVGDFWVLQPQNADSSFLYRLIQSRQFDEVANQSIGTKMPRADWKLVSKTVFSIPSNICEQAAIGTYFTALDHLITLHQRKLEKLKIIKKSMLENCFPKNGEKAPKIRFSGFSDDWEQRKLGDIYVERNERGNTELDILSVSIHHGISKNELGTDELGKSVRRSDDKSLYKHVYYGDLVFNMMRAWQGAIGVARNEGMVSPAYISAIPNGSIFPEYMDYCLCRKCIINQINNLSYGVTDFRKRLYWEPFTRVTIMMPSLDEQRKITDVLSRLDHLITLHQSKLEKLKMIKKSMLETMFI